MDILAKSKPQISLIQHIKDCIIIFNHLKECFPSVIKVCNTNGFDFWNTLRVTIIFHDLGKAHPEFQNVLRKLPDKWLKQRHELFSLPFINTLAIEDEFKSIILLIVAGHHKDYNVLHKEYLKEYSSLKPNHFGLIEDDLINFEEEFLKINEEEIRHLLNENFQITISEAKAIHPEKLILQYLQKANTKRLVLNEQYFQLLLLFGALKHCDHLGSAQLKRIEKLDEDDFVFLKQKRKKLILSNSDFYFHQHECAKAAGNVLLTAPTGSGKTESAMLWLNKQLNEFGQGRAFYVLPFTASINAMFERLSDNNEGLGNEKVGMLHGKLSDYLYDYFDEYQYDIKARKEEIDSLKEKFKTIYTPLKVITPFQLLKHLFGLKGFEQGLFECTGSYFIFDEIHAYSPSVFAQIKVLLEFVVKHLQAKVMIMTATMPSYLKKEIEATLEQSTEIVADKKLYESFDRHKISLHAGLLINNLGAIISDLKKGSKVLVVCNTVKESQNVYQELKKHAKKSVLLHSAFTGEDRTAHEKFLKEGEKDENHSIQLLVGTQAIEVSLDIDYDIIYTEPAPFDALIQRFGRVNRKRSKGICPVVVFTENNPNDRFIYKPDIISKTLSVIEEIINLDNGIIKEAKLQHYIDLVYTYWNEKGYSDFKSTYDLLWNSLTYLHPMIHSKHTEEEFYKQFDGIKVLPSSLKRRYTEHLKDFDFIGSERLKVQIRKNKFAQLINEHDNNLFKEEYAFENQQGKILTISYWLLNKKYDPKLGLLYDEQETWDDGQIS